MERGRQSDGSSGGRKGRGDRLEKCGGGGVRIERGFANKRDEPRDDPRDTVSGVHLAAGRMNLSVCVWIARLFQEVEVGFFLLLFFF